MDDSIKYIEMCRESKEMQDKRKEMLTHQSDKGDYNWYSNDGGQTSIRIYTFYGCAVWEYEGIWLPMQDQLQDIIYSGFPVLGQLARIRNITKSNKKYWNIFKTHEQLWLAIVMHEKYSKHWIGGKWEGKK